MSSSHFGRDVSLWLRQLQSEHDFEGALLPAERFSSAGALWLLLLEFIDLFCLSVPVVASLFLEDVTAWLELHDLDARDSVRQERAA